eukprot:s1557_g7.t1
MASSSNAPWRCRVCKQLRKHSASYCQTCEQPWQNVIDQTYVHGSKQNPAAGYGQSTQYTNQWQHQGDWQQPWQKQSSGRSPSRRRSKSARGNHTPRETQPQQPMPQMPSMPMMPTMQPNMPMQPVPHMFPQMQTMPMMPTGPMGSMSGYQPQQYAQQVLPPFPPPGHPPAAPKVPTPKAPAVPKTAAAAVPPMHPMMVQQYVPMAPGVTLPHCAPMPTIPTTTPSESEEDLRGLVTMMKGRQSELPLDIQQRVKEISIKEGARTTNDLYAAVGAMSDARDQYEAAVLARSQQHANWKKFLGDAVQLWQAYTTQFQEQERKLAEEVAERKEAFLLAKKNLENAKLESNEVHEVSDDDPGDLDNSTGASSATRITETIQGLAASLTNLHKETEALVAEEVPVAKRPRRHPPQPNDQSMNSPEAAEHAPTHFGVAG